MPGTKSLSGSESLPEAQDLMLHTPPANRWLPEVPLTLFFFIRASFLLSWSHESLCRSVCNAKGDPNSFLSFYGFTVSFF